MGYGYSRKRTEQHEKSMGSYVLHAWRDAMAIANLLNEQVGAERARKIYQEISSQEIMEYEQDNEEAIEEFIGLTEARRITFLRRSDVSEGAKIMFLVLAIIGCLRAKAALEIRDNHRYALVPGSGNRVTIAQMYRLFQDIMSELSYEWPYEPFSALGIHDSEDDD